MSGSNDTRVSPLQDWGTQDAASFAYAVGIRSQLPGRSNGPADILRHLVLAAELSRTGSLTSSRAILDAHEAFDWGSTPANSISTYIDKWVNEMGLKIGAYVRKYGGSAYDVEALSLSVIEQTFGPAGSWSNINSYFEFSNVTIAIPERTWSGVKFTDEIFWQSRNDVVVGLEGKGKINLGKLRFARPTWWRTNPDHAADFTLSNFPSSGWKDDFSNDSPSAYGRAGSVGAGAYDSLWYNSIRSRAADMQRASKWLEINAELKGSTSPERPGLSDDPTPEGRARSKQMREILRSRGPILGEVESETIFVDGIEVPSGSLASLNPGSVIVSRVSYTSGEQADEIIDWSDPSSIRYSTRKYASVDGLSDEISISYGSADGAMEKFAYSGVDGDKFDLSFGGGSPRVEYRTADGELAFNEELSGAAGSFGHAFSGGFRHASFVDDYGLSVRTSQDFGVWLSGGSTDDSFTLNFRSERGSSNVAQSFSLDFAAGEVTSSTFAVDDLRPSDVLYVDEIRRVDSAGQEVLDKFDTVIVDGTRKRLVGGAVVKTYNNGPLEGITRIRLDKEHAPLGFIQFDQVGAILGNLLGKSIAGDDRLTQIAASALLKTVGQTVGGVLNGVIVKAGESEIKDVIDSFDEELLRNLKLKAVGALSSRA